MYRVSASATGGEAKHTAPRNRAIARLPSEAVEETADWSGPEKKKAVAHARPEPGRAGVEEDLDASAIERLAEGIDDLGHGDAVAYGAGKSQRAADLELDDVELAREAHTGWAGRGVGGELGRDESGKMALLAGILGVRALHHLHEGWASHLSAQGVECRQGLGLRGGRIAQRGCSEPTQEDADVRGNGY